MPIYDFECPECNKRDERFLSMDNRDISQDCTCGHRMVRVMSLPSLPIVTITGRDKVLKTLNKEGGYSLPGNGKHDARYEQALAKGLERQGQPGKYRSGVSN